MTWQEFKNVAVNVAAQEGYPLSVLLGQAAHETGFGKSRRSQNNQWFGVGVYHDNSPGFQYKSAEDSIRGYIQLIKTDPRYARAWANRNNPTQMVREIANAGYAADPNYFNHVVSNKEFKQNVNKPNVTTINPENITTEQLRQNRIRAQQIQEQQMNPIPIAQTPEYKAAFNKKSPTVMDMLKSLISTATPKAHAQGTNQNKYTVKAGDTLFGIAQQRLGDGNRWGELQGYQGRPEQLPIGQQITMPSSTVVPKPPSYISTRQPRSVMFNKNMA